MANNKPLTQGTETMTARIITIREDGTDAKFAVTKTSMVDAAEEMKILDHAKIEYRVEWTC